MSYRKWCPNGCGKSVYYYGLKLINGKNKGYRCTRCDKRFTKEELDRFAKK